MISVAHGTVENSLKMQSIPKTSNVLQPEISVIIPTQNRAASLATTLECLASADHSGLQLEIIVVNNAGHDNTEEVVRSFQQRISIRYFYEPTLGTFGKSHALNRAFDAGNLGEIIVILDDDMSPHSDWFQGVAAICKRWPGKDLFTGNTYVIWPPIEIPAWARAGTNLGWLYADWHRGSSDVELPDGHWFLGGHFWFRSRVLNSGLRFKDMWLTEPNFQLELTERGFGGVTGPDAIAGHRVQPQLLQKMVVLDRAKKTGVALAQLRLQPYRNKVKHARLLHRHPCLGRLFCLLNCTRWCLCYMASYVYLLNKARFACRVYATERLSTYFELFRAANRLEAYSLSRRVRRMVVESQPNPSVQTSF
jgi:glycosyltransferase involved in cell wall biosynthesis